MGASRIGGSTTIGPTRKGVGFGKKGAVRSGWCTAYRIPEADRFAPHYPPCCRGNIVSAHARLYAVTAAATLDWNR